MTTPEDRDLWERDEEALRTPAPVDLMRSEAARVARYAEAILVAYLPVRERLVPWRAASNISDEQRRTAETYARAVVAVADEERAALVADLNNAGHMWKTAVARAEAAEAKVAKVQALADRLACSSPPEWVVVREVVDALRAALAYAPAEQRAEGGA